MRAKNQAGFLLYKMTQKVSAARLAQTPEEAYLGNTPHKEVQRITQQMNLFSRFRLENVGFEPAILTFQSILSNLINEFVPVKKQA